MEVRSETKWFPRQIILQDAQFSVILVHLVYFRKFESRSVKVLHFDIHLADVLALLR